MADENVPVPGPSPYPPDADPGQLASLDPSDGDEIEVFEVEFRDPPGNGAAVHPFVVAVAAGIVATMVYEGGSWAIKEAWQAGTREPVSAPRPPVLYDNNSGFTYVRQGDGSYLRSGTASQI